MTKLSDLGLPIPGKRHDGEPSDEDGHFYKCKICGQPADMRDLRQVMWHEQPRHERLKPEVVRRS
ncbi:hypothetical protein FJW08_31970 [Mesorhizobium sp. B3-2-1]|uniref:hypothetical protein n=1 Tax=unclassified Mesorhizobium TaxID=325217 RepID=UPI00112A9744|nr:MULTISPECIES: hypothetical protein [unclassified Mesorhizobium]MBZ9711552.1 hypothetical protein [Mesorhizobium sp. ESP7-2]TPI20385.1 hypothetical protein FJW08_31970 [Mesorhizobium sp. B3-2-1]